MKCACGKIRVYETECRDCYEDRIRREIRHQFDSLERNDKPSDKSYDYYMEHSRHAKQRSSK